jgi:hypothetical protein
MNGSEQLLHLTDAQFTDDQQQFLAGLDAEGWQTLADRMPAGAARRILQRRVRNERVSEELERALRF